MKFDLMATHRATWHVLIISDMLGVTRSGFYARLDRAASTRAQADAMLLVAIRASFALSDWPYGARCIVRSLFGQIRRSRTFTLPQTTSKCGAMNQDQHLLLLLLKQFNRAEWTRALPMVIGRDSGAALAIAFTGVSKGEQSIRFAMSERPDRRFLAQPPASLSLLSANAKARVVRIMDSAPASRQVVSAYIVYARLFATKDWQHWVELAEAGPLP